MWVAFANANTFVNANTLTNDIISFEQLVRSELRAQLYINEASKYFSNGALRYLLISLYEHMVCVVTNVKDLYISVKKFEQYQQFSTKHVHYLEH